MVLPLLNVPYFVDAHGKPPESWRRSGWVRQRGGEGRELEERRAGKLRSV